MKVLGLEFGIGKNIGIVRTNLYVFKFGGVVFFGFCFAMIWFLLGFLYCKKKKLEYKLLFKRVLFCFEESILRLLLFVFGLLPLLT